MKVWYDTEFIEDGRTIDLVSIGMVREDGHEYYAVSTEFDSGKADDWVRDNVLAHLPPEPHGAYVDRATMRDEILDFTGTDKPEFWAYYADYDWVVLAQLFGRMIDLPSGYPMYCKDLKQWCDALGNPELPAHDEAEHHALADARWNRKAYEFLQQYDI